MASVEAQGTILVARDGFRLPPPKQALATRRGKIAEFSPASRRRLIEMFARLEVRAIRVTFLTLTFSGVPTPAEAKVCFKRFTMRLRRAFPDMSAMWRMEAQERQSPHFHLIAFNLPYYDQKTLQNDWQECTGEARSIAHITLVRGGKRHALAYVSKYLAKVKRGGSASLEEATYQHAEGEFTDDPGRYWGYINRAKLPFAEYRFIDISDPAVFVALWDGMIAATNGRVGLYRHNARCYHDDVFGLIDQAFMVASCPLPPKD